MTAVETVTAIENMFDGVTGEVDTEVPPTQPVVEPMPEGEPPQPVPDPEESEQVRQALATAALIIKTATDEIEAAKVTYDTEAAANAKWASDLTKDAWKAAIEGRHCATWDGVMRQVGLPGRPQPVSFVCNATAKVTIAPVTVVEALRSAGIEFMPDSFKAFEAVVKDTVFEGNRKQYRYTIEVTPDAPDDPFNPASGCLCPQARRAFIEYVHQFVDRAVVLEEVTIERQDRCPASVHKDGIAPKNRMKK
jgi:hypothetical protein